MVGRTALALLLGLLMAQPVQAEWLQSAHDAARSGVADGDGPPWPDIGAIVPLAWENYTFTPRAMRVVAGDLYIAAGDVDVVTGGECSGALFRVRLPSAQAERLTCTDIQVTDLLSDGKTLM